MDVLVSIIVPVFNAEAFLDRCISSVLGQSFQEWELLLINDGSTDGSHDICQKYASKDSRIKFTDKKNGGASSARNEGLRKAVGKYVIFLDSDDYWFEGEALSTLYTHAENEGLDIIRGRYKAVDPEGKELFHQRQRAKFAGKEGIILDSAGFLQYAIDGEYFLPLSLIREDVVREVAFDEGMRFLEDMDFLARVLLKPLKCMFIPLDFYAYVKNHSSISYEKNMKHLEDSFSMCPKFHGYAAKAESLEVKDIYNRNSIMIYYWTSCTIASEGYYDKLGSILEELSLDRLHNDVMLWYRTFHCSGIPGIIRMKPKQGIRFLHRYLSVRDRMMAILSKAKHLIIKH